MIGEQGFWIAKKIKMNIKTGPDEFFWIVNEDEEQMTNMERND